MTTTTDWIQAICSILTVILAAVGLFRTIPKMKNDINKSADKRLDKFEQQMREHIRGYSDKAALDMWKRLINLYTKDPKLHEYSDLDEKTTKSN